MKSKEFCYWLQGYFELIGARLSDPAPSLSALTVLTQIQLKTVRNHLNLVKDAEPHLSGFCSWLDHVFELTDSGVVKIDETELSKQIQKKLQDEFVHVIDTEHGADLDRRKQIHSPSSSSSSPKNIEFLC